MIQVRPQLHTSRATPKHTSLHLCTMDQLWSYMPPSVAQLIQANGYQVTPEHAQWAGIAVVSLTAVYVGYLWSLSLKEAAVTFNVPVPVEVRNSADGKQWETVTGMEKRILENQVRGVSLHVSRARRRRVLW